MANITIFTSLFYYILIKFAIKIKPDMMHFCKKCSKIIPVQVFPVKYNVLWDYFYNAGGVYVMKQIIVGIADMKVGSGTDEIVTYALGSCIGVCMYDEIAQIGGMLHAMLPKQGPNANLADTDKYVDSGIVHLYRILCRRGAGTGRIKAKIIGGANMFRFDKSGRAIDIGTLNVKEAKQSLVRFGIPITAEMTGGDTGRTVYFTAGTGEVKIRTTENQKFVI